MTILLVDTDAVRMRQTAKMIQALVPDTEGFSTTDPLLAAKYAFEHPVDLLIAGLYMKRMDGPKLSAFLREKNPAVKTCLYGTPQELAHCSAPEAVFYPLLLPIKEASLRTILDTCGHSRRTS